MTQPRLHRNKAVYVTTFASVHPNGNPRLLKQATPLYPSLTVSRSGRSPGVLRSRQDEKQRAAAEGLGRRGEQDAEWDGEWRGA